MRGRFVKKIERHKGYVDIDEVYEALDGVEKEEDCEYGDYGEILSKWATCDYGEVWNAISCCTVVEAIPLDRIKQAKEDIQKKAFTEEIFDEDVFNFTYTENVSKETAECESYVETEVVKMSDVLEILNRLTAESEG